MERATFMSNLCSSLLDKYSYQPIDENTCSNIKLEIQLQLTMYIRENFNDIDSNNVDITIKQNRFNISKIDIIPNNLYTLILLNNEYYPSMIIRGNKFESDNYRYEFFEDNHSKIYKKE